MTHPLSISNRGYSYLHHMPPGSRLHEHNHSTHTAALPRAALLLVSILKRWSLLVENREVGRLAPKFPGQVAVVVVLKMSYLWICSLAQGNYLGMGPMNSCGSA